MLDAVIVVSRSNENEECKCDAGREEDWDKSVRLHLLQFIRVEIWTEFGLPVFTLPSVPSTWQVFPEPLL